MEDADVYDGMPFRVCKIETCRIIVEEHKKISMQC